MEKGRDTERERGWGAYVYDRLDIEKNGEEDKDENDRGGRKWSGTVEMLSCSSKRDRGWKDDYEDCEE